MTKNFNSELENLVAEVARLRQEAEKLRQERNDLELLLDFNTEHSTALEYDLNLENKSARRELQIAREIQDGFLPERLPTVPGWELEVLFKPARQVGGDFYDLFLLPGDRLGFVIADVCDKGVGAAIFMTLTRTLIRVLAQQTALRMQKPAQPNSEIIPSEVNETLQTVQLTNEYLVANHRRSNMFATLFFGVLEIKSGLLYYVNGGQDAPVILGKAGLQARLLRSGYPVGTLPHLEYQVRQTQIQPGETLLAYTNGIPDARDSAGQPLGERELLNRLHNLGLAERLGAPQLLSELVATIENHIEGSEPFDDISALILHFLPNPD